MMPLDFPRTAAVCLTLPLPPVLNSYYATVRGRVIVSHEGKAYKKALWESHGDGRHLPLVGLVAVTRLAFYARSQDIDAGFKALFDSLQGIAWLDDRQVRLFDGRVELHLDTRMAPASERVELNAEGERFATMWELRADLARRRETANKAATTRAMNRAAKATGLLERAQGRAAPITLRPNVVLPFRRGPEPIETHLSDCLKLYGKGAKCTCGAVKSK